MMADAGRGMRLCGCGALQVCLICETCEDHCHSSGSGRCIAAHDDWLAGGAGGLEGLTSATPLGRPPFSQARTAEMRTALLLAQDELLAENGLRRCSGCRGLQDPNRPHQHDE